MNSNKFILLLLCWGIASLVLSCDSGGDSEPSQPPEPVVQNNLPAKVSGFLPANGEPCSDYEEVVNYESKVLVPFEWNSAQFSESYTLVVFENNSEVFRDNGSTLKRDVELDRGKTYTWQVISVNTNGQTPGDTFSFTTPGTPVGNFAPYAAEISITFNSSNSEMMISWIGSDEDGDILAYDVTMMENTEVIANEINTGKLKLDTIVYQKGAEYIVKVISKDTSGNFSISSKSEIAPE